MATFPTTVAPDFGVRKYQNQKCVLHNLDQVTHRDLHLDINQNLKIYNLSFTNITETESDEIETFLDARAGV